VVEAVSVSMCIAGAAFRSFRGIDRTAIVTPSTRKKNVRRSFEWSAWRIAVVADVPAVSRTRTPTEILSINIAAAGVSHLALFLALLAVGQTNRWF